MERNMVQACFVSKANTSNPTMKQNLLFLALLTGVILSACNGSDDEQGSLRIHYLARYDDQPLAIFTDYDTPSGDQIQFTHVSLIVSDLSLYNNPSSTLLQETNLIDLGFDDIPAATIGAIQVYNEISAGAYDGIRFGIGVPADMNTKKPADFPSTHPLSFTGYYWEAWDSYIFMKIEGRLDNGGDGVFDTPFAFHTGSNALYSILETPIPVTIEDSKTAELHIAIDYKKLLEGIDIKSNPQNHNPEDSLQIGKIVSNIPSSVVLFP